VAIFTLQAGACAVAQDRQQVPAATPKFDMRGSSDDFDAKFCIIQNHREIIRMPLSHSCVTRARARPYQNLSKLSSAGGASKNVSTNVSITPKQIR
jgi:hypothetical protein